MNKLSARGFAELAEHEGIVLEWYLDNAKPPRGTWALGVTDASGHAVGRYRDNPQPLERCLEVSRWLADTTYVPQVVKAFRGRELTEAQLAAGTCFHYNTGAIGITSWVTLFCQGREAEARAFLETHYLNDGVLKERRMREAALFFDGVWSGDWRVPVYPVRKPSYRPDFGKAKLVDIREYLS